MSDTSNVAPFTPAAASVSADGLELQRQTLVELRVISFLLNDGTALGYDLDNLRQAELANL